ncbi:MAG: hypothetical protein IPI73_02570 [Betaproteobacteria bacterium]|nr:hypothetical protein [Betaproteobacteria bacterium]
MILSAVKRNLSLRVVVATLHCEQHCDPANECYRPKIHLLQQLVAQGDSRIALLDSSFSDLVRLVPDIGTETEEDKLRSMLGSSSRDRHRRENVLDPNRHVGVVSSVFQPSSFRQPGRRDGKSEHRSTDTRPGTGQVGEFVLVDCDSLVVVGRISAVRLIEEIAL